MKISFLSRRLAIAWKLLRSGDIINLTRRSILFLKHLKKSKPHVDYQEWRMKWVESNDTIRSRIDELISVSNNRPTFDIVMPISTEDIETILPTVKSLISQRYPNWTLHLTSPKPLEPSVAAAIAEEDNRRVRLAIQSPEFSGNWISHIEPGDLLHETALFAVTNALNKYPDAAIIYTDNDHVETDGTFTKPHMKPDWNPDLLTGMNYFGILTFYQTELWRIHSSPNINTHELATRITENLESRQIIHIPHILASKKLSPKKSNPAPKTVRIKYDIPNPIPKVSVIIPTRNQGRMLTRCVTGVKEKTCYPNIELIIVDHESTQRRVQKLLVKLSKDNNTKIITYKGTFNFAAMINRGVEISTGQILVLLNNDIEIVDSDWLTELSAQVSRPEIGIVGPLLTFKDDTIQHAGIHPGLEGLMGHGHKHLPKDHPGYFGRLRVAHNVAAVTGACLAIKKKTWDELGGLDEKNLAVAYNDVDLCLRARKAGLRVLFTPHTHLIHHESATRGVDEELNRNPRLEKELQTMKKRWGNFLKVDPAYNPNLALEELDFRIAKYPRVKPDWSE